MKLSYEDKVQIYDLRQKGTSWPSLSKQFSVAESRLKYIVRLIDRYGIGIVKKEKNTYYPPVDDSTKKVVVFGRLLSSKGSVAKF